MTRAGESLRGVAVSAGNDPHDDRNRRSCYLNGHAPANISDRPPTEYVSELRLRFVDQDRKAMHESHAMPQNWKGMAYEDSLVERRKLMAAIIRRGFDSLK